METLRQIRDQSFSMFGDMRPHQRLTFVALALVVLAPFAWLIFASQNNAYVPLQWGAQFDSEKLHQAEQALIERGLSDFQTVGQSSQVPAEKADEYNAALLSTGNWSPHAVDEREQALKELSIFTPREHFQAHMDVHLQKDVSRILRSIKGIRTASVLWTRAKEGYRNIGKDKASVYATPSGAEPLSSRLIQSLRASVSTVLPGLKPADIVVVDQSTGQAWTENSSDALYRNEREARKREIVLEKQLQIQSHLDDTVPGAVATVNIEFDDVVLTTDGNRDVQENVPNPIHQTQHASLDAKAMQVVVSIPEQHIEMLVTRTGMTPGSTEQEQAEFQNAVDAMRTTEIEKVRKNVSTLLPGAAPDAVTVSTFHRVDPNLSSTNLAATDLLREFAVNWGSTLGLVAFVIWALLMVRQSMPVSTRPGPTDALEHLAKAVEPSDVIQAESEKSTRTPREVLQERVRSNPAVAADVIAKMLQGA